MPPMMQKELDRLQFRNDFLDAQAAFDMMEPEEDIEDAEADADLPLYFYSVRHDA